MGMARGRGSREVRTWLMLSEGVHGLETFEATLAAYELYCDCTLWL